MSSDINKYLALLPQNDINTVCQPLIEIFSFAASPYSKVSTSSFMYNIVIFDHFILYFNEELEKIIMLTEQNWLAAPDSINPGERLIQAINDSIEANVRESFFEMTRLDQLANYANNKENYLSESEMTYMALSIAGFSNQKISTLLQINPEKIRDELKQKLLSKPDTDTVMLKKFFEMTQEL